MSNEAAVEAFVTDIAGVGTRTVHVRFTDVYGARHNLSLDVGVAAELVGRLNRAGACLQRPPGARSWVLDLGDGLVLSRCRARKRVRRVDAERIEEAVALAAGGPHGTAFEVAYGRDVDGQLVQARIDLDLAGLPAERAAAIRWLSGAPRAEWRQVEASGPGTVR